MPAADSTAQSQGIGDATGANQGMGTNPTTSQENIYCTATADRFLVPFPTLLQGTRCYVDASTQPDLAISTPRDAGLGIFIVNTQVHPTQSIFIRAAMKDSSSVLMAEEAALTLAATVLEALHMFPSTILSDNQQLVHFLNGSQLDHPSDWRIKPYTQIISSKMNATTMAIRKISRAQSYGRSASKTGS